MLLLVAHLCSLVSRVDLVAQLLPQAILQTTGSRVSIVPFQDIAAGCCVDGIAVGKGGEDVVEWQGEDGDVAILE